MSGRMLHKVIGLMSLAILLVSVLVTSGCATKPTAEEIVTNVQEVMASTNDVHAMIEMTAATQSESVCMTVEVWGKQPNKARAEVLEVDRTEFANIVTTTDGHTVWFYNPAENQVIVGDASQMPDTTPQEIIQDMDGLIQRVLDASDIELLGEEDVAGVETYKLRLTPKESEEQPLPVTGTATLWVDQKQWIVLRAHLVVPNIGEGTMEVSSLELNQGLEDKVFTFEVPEGVEVIEARDIKPQHMTLDEAMAQADFDLLTPEHLPDGATLVDVIRASGAFVLLYDLDGTTFSVTQSSEELPSEPSAAGETLTVRGVQATLIIDSVTGASFLAWQEKGIKYAVAGRIDQEEAIKIAESLK